MVFMLAQQKSAQDWEDYQRWLKRKG